jgi:hypothetical protein
MGVNILNSLRFPEVDYSSARNDFGGLYKILLISVGAEICFIGDTNSIVTKSVCTAIGAIVDNDLIDIFFFT